MFFLKEKRGFALITVFLISVILFGMISFTFISVNRQGNIRNINTLSKTALTVGDAGLEEMIREIQSYHIDTISEYWLKRYLKKEGYITDIDVEAEIGEPALFSYYPELYTSYNPNSLTPEIPETHATRAKYFLNQNFNYIKDLDNDGEYDAVKWEDMDNDGLLDPNEESKINVKALFAVDILKEVTDKLQYFRDSSEETKVNEVINDIQSSYNIWETYVLNRISNMLNVINTNPVVPYDIDSPTTDVKYEGVIIKTAWEIVVDVRKIVLSSIGYSFNKPIPNSTYDSIKSLIVYKEEYDKEYTDKKIKILDLDTTNNNIKSYGYELTPIKRGIRGEYEIPLTSLTSENIKKLVKEHTTASTYQDYVSFSDYLVAFRNTSGSNYGFGYDEDLHGPIRANGSIYFSGEIWDTITSSSNVYDDFLNWNNSGRFYFEEEKTIWIDVNGNGIQDPDELFQYWYDTNNNGVKDPGEGYNLEFKVWPLNGPDANIKATTPHWFDLDNDGVQDSGEMKDGYWYDANNNGLIDTGEVHSKVKIVHDGPEKKYFLDLNFNNTYVEGVDNVLVYSRLQPEMDFSKVQTAGTNIKNSVDGTDYYFGDPDKTLQIHFQENETMQIKYGNGPSYDLAMPTNASTTITLEDGTQVTVNQGVIYARGNVEVRGKVNGRVTIYSEKSIWIMSDLTYVDPPNTNKNSDPLTEGDIENGKIDTLGLIAHDNVVIHKNAPEHLRIDAAILAQTGWWGIDPNANEHKYNANGHVLDFRGSQTFYSSSNAPAIISGDNVKGYETQLQWFDYNMRYLRPPMFPNVGDEIVDRQIIPGTTLDEIWLTGKVESSKFGRILWRELANPP